MPITLLLIIEARLPVVSIGMRRIGTLMKRRAFMAIFMVERDRSTESSDLWNCPRLKVTIGGPHVYLPLGTEYEQDGSRWS